jgi:hypothetical protein
MIRRLVEAHYFQNREKPMTAQIKFWLRELRTPLLLIETARSHTILCRKAILERPLSLTPSREMPRRWNGRCVTKRRLSASVTGSTGCRCEGRAFNAALVTSFDEGYFFSAPDVPVLFSGNRTLKTNR